MHSFKTCPVCSEPYLLPIGTKTGLRSHIPLTLFSCLYCQSLSNPSPYVEDDRQLARDLEWHKNVAARNEAAARTLLSTLSSRGADLSSIVEIGPGIGTVLSVAKREYQSKTLGFEMNPYTGPYAKSFNGIEIVCEKWDPSKSPADVTLFLCIMVLEHLADPRPLIKDLVSATQASGAALFVSVPLFRRNDLRFLAEPDARAPGNPFFDPDVHVTHFSEFGLEYALRKAGAHSVDWIRTGMWHGTLARRD